MVRVLVGDIGGTNTRLRLYDGHCEQHSERLPSAEIVDLRPVIERFLAAAGTSVDAICLAAAGPAKGGRVELTNLSWYVDQHEISASLGAPCRVFNDFYAQALAVTRLGPDDVVQLGGGSSDPEAPIAVIGAGTGLGEAYVVPALGGRYSVLPTEGGHARYAPRGEREIALLRALRERTGRHVSVERVLSGPGLINIHAQICRSRSGNASCDHAPIDSTGDPAGTVARHAIETGCEICRATLDIFVAAYADEAANMALKLNAAGGIYITGGIAPRILPELQRGRFRRCFVQKGRFETWLESVPTWVVTHADPGLLGALAEAEHICSEP